MLSRFHLIYLTEGNKEINYFVFQNIFTPKSGNADGSPRMVMNVTVTPQKLILEGTPKDCLTIE